MSDFNENNYVKVNERLKAFRDQYPEGSIHTIRGEDKEGIFFKCLVFRNPNEVELYGSTGIAAATGHAYLPDYAREEEQKVEEYAETVSIGRALACLGYSVDKSIASAEEMEQYNRLHGEQEEDYDDEEDEEVEEKPRRISRKSASKNNKKDESEEGEPKLKSSRKIKRSSKLSSRKRRKGD